MESGIRELAVSLIEGLKPKGGCNFIDDFALHLPINIFMRLVDLPPEHRLGLLELSDRIQHPSEERKDDVLKLIIDYLRPIVVERKARPGKDLISKVAQGQIHGRPLSELEILQVCALLLGGLDTVAWWISGGPNPYTRRSARRAVRIAVQARFWRARKSPSFFRSGRSASATSPCSRVQRSNTKAV